MTAAARRQRAPRQVSTTEALQGLVMPAASYVLLGKGGAVLVIVICFMAVTSSGASEMVAVSSLFTFDIYRKYIHPQVPPFIATPSPQKAPLVYNPDAHIARRVEQRLPCPPVAFV